MRSDRNKRNAKRCHLKITTDVLTGQKEPKKLLLENNYGGDGTKGAKENSELFRDIGE